MHLCSSFVKARCLFHVLLFALMYGPKSITAFSSGQGIPCIDQAATSSHGANSGGLSGSTVIRVNGFVRKSGATVTIEEEKAIKIVIENSNAIGLMLYLKSDKGQVLTNRFTTKSGNMTKMTCTDTSSAALIHKSSDLKPRESFLLNTKGIKGTMTLSISVLINFSEWYYGTIKLKIAPPKPTTKAPTKTMPVKTPIKAPAKVPPVKAPAKALPVKAPVKSPLKAPAKALPVKTPIK
jgi:hypothetical protein